MNDVTTTNENSTIIRTKHAKKFKEIVFPLKGYFPKAANNEEKHQMALQMVKKYHDLIEKNGDVESNITSFLMTSGLNLYFAYGSNMDKTQMKSRCENAVYICNGTLENYKFVLDAKGKASVLPQTNSKVEGAIWVLKDDEEFTLDRFEGVNKKKPCYSKEHLNIMCNNMTVPMLVYVSNRDITNEAIDAPYMDKIINAAKDIHLSNEYISDELETFVEKTR